MDIYDGIVKTVNSKWEMKRFTKIFNKNNLFITLQ